MGAGAQRLPGSSGRRGQGPVAGSNTHGTAWMVLVPSETRGGASMRSCRCPGGPLPPASVGCSLPRRAGRSAMPDAPPPPWPSSWSLAFSFVQRDCDRCSQPGPRPSLSVPGGLAAAVPPSGVLMCPHQGARCRRWAAFNCTCLSPLPAWGSLPWSACIPRVGGVEGSWRESPARCLCALNPQVSLILVNHREL